MSRYVIILFVIQLICADVLAQTGDTVALRIRGRVTDLASGRGADGVHISVVNYPTGTTSNADGSFNLSLVLHKDSFPVTLKFSHVSFETHTTTVGQDFSRFMEVRLTPNIQNMKVVEVYSGPRQVMSPYFSQILDYEVYEEKIVVLEKLDRGRKCRVRVVDFYGNLLGETTVKGKAVSLFRDCRDEVYLIMYDRYLKIQHDVGVTVSRSSQNLENRIKNPCRILTDSFLVYEEYGYARLMSWFLKRRTLDRYSTLFYYSADRTTMRLIQEDLLDLQEKYGNIIQDLMYLEYSLDNNPETRVRNLVMDEDLSQSVFYQANYCPMFLYKDQIVVFDHGHSQIVKLDMNGKPISGKRIRYHKKLAWEPQVYFDHGKNAFFTVMKKGPWISLYKIDLNTGEIKFYHKIENVFPEKIKLYDGYLMYLYRKPQTPDRYSLYLEKY